MNRKQDSITDFESTASLEEQGPLAYPTIKPAPRKTADSPPLTPVNVEAKAFEHSLEEAKHQEEFIDKRSKVIAQISQVESLLDNLVSPPNDAAGYLNSIAYTKNLKVFNIDFRNRGRAHEKNILSSLDLKEDDEIYGQLLKKKFTEAVGHLQKLKSRVNDTTSKILITGDLNSGKSTFINALLRRDLLPSDQQPCTTIFCEVMNANFNNGTEEVHLITDPMSYDVYNRRTYSSHSIDHIKDDAREENPDYSLAKVYCKENSGLLNNGIVDLVLIDSPGLNRDLSQTMAVFAQQQEIDAVIFVVNAENHFTLSGSEFLNEAQHEKPYMFIVVNRFDTINDTNRCKKDIMRQVKELVPKTYEEADELVHFVSAREFVRQQNEEPESTSDVKFAFKNLEACLKSFLLGKRMKSKLFPAIMYLENVLSDVLVLSQHNLESATATMTEADQKLRESNEDFALVQKIDKTFADFTHNVSMDTLKRIQKSREDMVSTLVKNIGSNASEVYYPGILRIWAYAAAIIRDANIRLVEEIKKHEEESSNSATLCLDTMFGRCKDLPGWSEIANPKVSKLIYTPDQKIKLDPITKDLIRVQVEMSDFMEIPSNIGISAATSVSVIVVTSGFIGYKRVLNGLMHIGSMVGLSNMFSVVCGAAVVVGVGSTAIVLSNAKHTVQVQMARKIRRHIRKSQRIQDRLSMIEECSMIRMNHGISVMKSNLKKVSDHHSERVSSATFSKAKADYRKSHFETIRYKANEGLAFLATLKDSDDFTNNGKIIHKTELKAEIK
ncbi:hypothetical protein MP638_003406 [Amoeboaphelidium occidentale]|nr:hypothetical protein MP638_003406 [Amoeboaphelidium occidentale]